jgi:hypothetical protein
MDIPANNKHYFFYEIKYSRLFIFGEFNFLNFFIVRHPHDPPHTGPVWGIKDRTTR